MLFCKSSRNGLPSLATKVVYQKPARNNPRLFACMRKAVITSSRITGSMLMLQPAFVFGRSCVETWNIYNIQQHIADPSGFGSFLYEWFVRENWEEVILPKGRENQAVNCNSDQEAILILCFLSSILKLIFAFNAVNTRKIVSIVTFVVLFSSFEICAF